MFWPFLEIDGELSYCPLADFGAQDQREGKDIYAKAVVAQPLTGHLALRNAELVKGKVVVMERGACDFVTKVLHAQAAGAVAVIVANTRSEEDPSAAFVMDAGSRQSDAESIRIPAIMLAHGKAAAVFERIRASYLDRQEFALTIKFLGARAAAQVMEQIEQSANEKQRSEREEQRRLETEQQQVEAARQLRSRLSENRSSPATCSIASTPSSASRTPSSVADGSRKGSRSAKSCFEAPQGREFCVERNCDDTSSAESGDSSSRASSCSGGSLYVDTRDSSRGVRAAEVTNHWCPMTTALLIMDVQNYFALHQNEKCLVPHASVNLAYYKRINSVMVPTIQDVLLACRASEGVEVVYSVVESATRDGRDRSRAHKHAGIHIAKSGFGAKVLPRIAPMENDIVIPRTGVNVFESTNLDYTLRTLGVSHVVVLGISTLTSLQVCIQSALDKGYQVTVLREGVTLEADVFLDEWLDGVERIGCQVQSAASFVREVQTFAYPEIEDAELSVTAELRD